MRKSAPTGSTRPSRKADRGEPGAGRGLLLRLRHRIEVGLALLLRALFRAPSLERSLALGGVAGRLYGRLFARRADVSRRNLALAFPELPEPERERIRIAAFENLGRLAAETARLGDLTPEEARARISIEGIEHLEQARKESPTGGAIILTMHYGSWELCAAAMAMRGLPLSIVHRAPSNPWIDGLITGWRERAGIEVLTRGAAARDALRTLRSGRLLVVPLDQNAKRREGVFVPFFGTEACTRDGPARIAMRLGVPVVPAWMERIGTGPRHVIRIRPAVALVSEDGDPNAAVRENVARMTRALEEAIRGAPEQWIWNHRRWHTRPEGAPRLYRSKRRSRR